MQSYNLSNIIIILNKKYVSFLTTLNTNKSQPLINTNYTTITTNIMST